MAAREERRLLSSLGGGGGGSKYRTSQAVHPSDGLTIRLEGLPAAPGAPVQLLVNNKLFFDSGHLNGEVCNTSIRVPPLHKDIEVELKINKRKFSQRLKVRPEEGHHLKLALVNQQFDIKQTFHPS